MVAGTSQPKDEPGVASSAVGVAMRGDGHRKPAA